MKKYFYILVSLFILIFGFSACQDRPRPGRKPISREAELTEEKQKKILDNYYRKVLEMTPQSSEEYMSRGFGYYYNQQFDKARADFTKALGMYEAKADYESAREVQKYIDLLSK